MQDRTVISGYARVSTDGLSMDAQARQPRAAGCEEVLREVTSGAGGRSLPRRDCIPTVAEFLRDEPDLQN